MDQSRRQSLLGGYQRAMAQALTGG